MHLRHTRSRFIVLFWFVLLTGPAIGQADTLFRHPPDLRIVWLQKITFERWAGTGNLEPVNKYYDTIESRAAADGDARTKWYARFYRRICEVYRMPAGEGQLEGFRNMESWIDHCPLPVLHGAFMHMFGAVLFGNEYFREAFEYQLRAARIFKEIGYDQIPEMYGYLQGMALTYYFLEDYPRTLQLMQAVEKSPYHSSIGLINNLNTQGLCYQKMLVLDSATKKFSEAYHVARAHGDSVWTGITAGNYGNTLYMQGKNEEGRNWLAIDFRLNVIAESKNTAITAVYLAKTYIKDRNAQAARHYLDTSRVIEGGTNDPVYYTHYYETKARYFELLHDYRNANLYLDSTLLLKDSLKRKYNIRLLSNIEKRFEAESFVARLDTAEMERKNSIFHRNVVIVCSIIALIFGLLLLRLRYRSFRREKELHVEREKMMVYEQQRVKEKLKDAELQLSDYIMVLTEKNELIGQIQQELDEVRQQSAAPEKLQSLSELLQLSLLTDNDWERFKELFEKVHPYFLAELKGKYPQLTPAETRLLCLIKLNLSPREMSAMLGVSSTSVTKIKYRLRKKLAESMDDPDIEGLVKGVNATT